MKSRELLSGNEAIARGAWEAGAAAAFGYPGTPSTEILENLVAHKDDIYLEWAPNEKVAFEAAAGAAFAGARSLVTMKHVGLNVAADPLMTLAYIGVEGGMVICVADDPGQHSSQNEQDSRHFARFAQIPVLEPSDSEEALLFVKLAFELSEKYKTPVMLRTTTRVSHSKSLVVLGERRQPNAVHFERNPERFVPIPVWGRVMRRNLDTRIKALGDEASAHPANRIEWNDTKRGFIAEGLAYQYLREVFPDASVLKLGFAWPYPDAIIREFAVGVDELIVIEENDTFLEEHVKSLGIACRGRELISGIGELSVPKILALKAALDGTDFTQIAPIQEAASLPARPPVLCPGCPHRGVFSALGKHDVIVTGDIGCYSLGVFPPLSRTDTILCMGGGFSVAQGIDKAGEKRRVVGIVGDSTFFHSGITGLLDVVYNKGRSVLIVLDNRTTAMTGHQDHPGTGTTLMGDATTAVSIEAVGKACGMNDVITVNPYDLKETSGALSGALTRSTPTLIVARAPCPLRERKNVGPIKKILPDKCRSCFACVRLGCPAIEAREKGKPPVIDSSLCAGCNLCQQVCGFDAIVEGESK
jgi:indolepyruvate ferredoxin oxidoreductase alpha subunit